MLDMDEKLIYICPIGLIKWLNRMIKLIGQEYDKE